MFRKGPLQRLWEEADGCKAFYLQLLANKYGDFKVTSSFKLPNGNYCWLKHISVIEATSGIKGKYGDEIYRLDNATHREILPNELVLDFDDSKTAKRKVKESIVYLDKYGLQYELFKTHSRGYHIHIIFSTLITKEAKQFIIRKFKGDIAKAGKTMIALEFSKHWKSGKIKEVVDYARITRHNSGRN